MPYRQGDQLKGIIYKGDEKISAVKFATVKKNDKFSTLALEAFEFDIFTQGKPELEVNDVCRLETDEGETELQIVSISPEVHGIVVTMFIFMQPYQD